MGIEDGPAGAEREPPRVDPSRTSPVAIGSAPGAAAMTILVRITARRVARWSRPRSCPPRRPRHRRTPPGGSTPTRIGTTALRMTARLASDERDPRQYLPGAGRRQGCAEKPRRGDRSVLDVDNHVEILTGRG
jgi:hypothetical protein